MRTYLFLGLFVLLLTFWKGDGGYLDLREYLDDAERIWLKGDLRLPSQPGQEPQYNRYSLGLPFLSGPLMLTGQGLSWLSGGVIGRRAVAALTVPLMAALAGLCLFEIALLLRYSPRVAFAAALVYCLGSPQLSYARFFHPETGVAFGLIVSAWGFLKYAYSGRVNWLLASGTGLAIAVACHYPHAIIVCCVTLFYLAGMYAYPRKSISEFLARGAFLALPLLVAACAIAAINLLHFHSLVPTGYQQNFNKDISNEYIVGNLHNLLIFLTRVPWFAFAFAFGIMALRNRKVIAVDFVAGRYLSLALAVGICAQLVFWLRFLYLETYPVRYLAPLMALAVLGLPAMLDWLESKLPGRGLSYMLLTMIVYNLARLPGDTVFQPIFFSPVGESHEVWMYAWYMRPIAVGAKFDAGSPVSILQVAILVAHLALGIWLLWRAQVKLKDQSLITHSCWK